MLLENLILVALGLIALFVGGDWLVKGAARLASSFGISAMMVGLTVVAFGTSAPELLVSVSAALQGSSDIALGNVIGSNIANIGFILGLTAFVFPITVEWRFIRREIPLMIGVTLAVSALALDGELSRFDGLLMMLGFIGFTVFSYVIARRDSQHMNSDIVEYNTLETINTPKIDRTREAARLVVGVILLAVGAQLTVDGAVAIARSIGVSELLIGVTVVAFGTSLPELSASLVGALRRENDIVMGNVIGSNIANLLMILGLTSVLRPIPVGANLLWFEVPVMIGFSLMLLPFLRDCVLRRREGVAFIAAYLGFVAYSIVR